MQRLGNGIVEGGQVADPLRAAEAGFHGAFILIHGVDARDQIPHQEPGDKTDDRSEKDAHKVAL